MTPVAVRVHDGVHDQRIVALDVTKAPLLPLGDGMWLDVAAILAAFERHGREPWELTTIEVTGQIVTEDGTRTRLTTRRHYAHPRERRRQYYLAGAPAWLRELLARWGPAPHHPPLSYRGEVTT